MTRDAFVPGTVDNGHTHKAKFPILVTFPNRIKRSNLRFDHGVRRRDDIGRLDYSTRFRLVETSWECVGVDT